MPGTFGALLREYRRAANLTQAELAERAGLSVEGIGALERGDRRSPWASTVESLAEALKLETQQKHALIAAARGPTANPRSLVTGMPTAVPPPRASLPTGSRMPLAPNPLFVGREEEILEVAVALETADATIALGQVVASTGLGGLGKTQLAVEVVHRYGRFFAGGVFWLSFARAEEIPLQVAACAGSGAAGLEADLSSRPLEERVKLVMGAWQSAVPRLLVFDNCEEESLLEAWRPTSGGCRVLVTSRRSHWSPTLGVTALPLGPLPRSDSVELLRRYRHDREAGDPRLDAIADRLGDLPLALHLAGQYLLVYRAEVGLDDYLAELDRPDVIGHASLLGEGLDDSPSPTHHAQSVAQTFALCLGRLDREREVDRVAIALLARMAWLAPGEQVPRDLLGRTMEQVGARRRADGLRRLGAVGLVEEGEGWLRLHRLLVHFVRQESLDPSAQAAVATALIASGREAEQGHLTGSALAAVIPHLIDVARAAVDDARDEELAADLCTAAGRALENVGHLAAARPWYELALVTRERVPGPDHPDTATSLNDLAWLLHELSDPAAARPLYDRALDIRERVLGPDHPDTAQVLNNLGVLLHEQGDLLAAGCLYERALDVRERVLGADHPDTSESLNNLAGLLYVQGKLGAATSLYERALAIRERVLGPDHPKTVMSLFSLGVVVRDQGELDAARRLLEQALAIRERVLGPDHPDTASSLNGLGRVLHAQGELAAARTLYERVLDIRERVLGADHAHTALPLRDLAKLLRDQGDLGAARPLFERALAIRERALGPDHPLTAASRGDLASLPGDQEDAGRPPGA